MNLIVIPLIAKDKKIDIQRLRTLTTGRLHTKMEHIYKDLGMITGEDVLMTHTLPRVMKAIEPWLRDNVSDPRFWDGELDTAHAGEIDLPTPTDEDRKIFFERLKSMPNPLAYAEDLQLEDSPDKKQCCHVCKVVVGEKHLPFCSVGHDVFNG